MKKSESIIEISKAMVSFQKEVKQPFKDASNPFFKSKYVPLESVVEAITDIAPKHGLSFTQWALNDENGRVGVATLLMHESGEFIEYDPVFMQAEKQTPQGAGALITYLKRYTLSAIFGITSDQDDDGNSASKPNEPNTRPDSITPQQIGLLKTKAGQMAKLHNITTEQVFQKINVTNIETLTTQQAATHISNLDLWMGENN